MRFLSFAAALLLATSMVHADFVDNFDGSALDARWTPSARAGISGYNVSGGNLNATMDVHWMDWPVDYAMFSTAAPTGDYTATMKATFHATSNAIGIPNVGIGAYTADGTPGMMGTYEMDERGWATDPTPIGYHLSTKTYNGNWQNGDGQWPYGLAWGGAALPAGTPDAAFYLRLTRTGENYDLSFSSNGTDFTSFFNGAYTGTAPLTKISMSFYGASEDEVNGTSPQIANVDSFTLTSVPEPATMCLLAIGALGLIRRKKA